MSDLSYASVHIYLRRDRGPATEQECIGCGNPAQEWAYDHSDPDELLDEVRQQPYSLDQDRYRPMCIPCHRKVDRGGTLGECPQGHDRATSGYVWRDRWHCQKCRTEYMRKYREKERN